MGDPFRFIDGIFTGIVQFIFNAVWSMFTLLRDPIRGTIRLVVRYRCDNTQQLSYVTLLFLINSASYLYYGVVASYPIFGHERYQSLYTEVGKHIFRSTQGPDTIKILIYATAATALQQLWLLAEIPERSKLRNSKTITLKLGYLFVYLYLLWFIIQVICTAIVYFGVYFINREILIWGPIVIFLAGFVIVILALYKTRAVLPRVLRTSIGLSLPIMLITSQIVPYLFIRVFDGVSGAPLEIRTLRCSLSNQSFIDVETILVNSTDQQLVLRRLDMTILGMPRQADTVGQRQKAQADAEAPIYRDIDGILWLEPDPSFPRYTILEPKKATQLKFKSKKWDGSPSHWGNARCGLRVKAMISDVADEEGRWSLPKEYRAESYERF